MEIDKGVTELRRRLADEDNMVTVITDPLIEEAVTLSRGHGLKVSIVNMGGKPQSFPSSEAYNFIFLTATILSIVSILLAVVLFRTSHPKCQNHLPAEKGSMATVTTENIKQEILSWPGVTSNPYYFGGIEFRVNKRDMGHIHGDKLADLPFPIEIRKDLIVSGKALPHIIYPESVWVSYFIRSEEDAPKIVELFRLQYERLKYKSSIASPR